MLRKCSIECCFVPENVQFTLTFLAQYRESSRSSYNSSNESNGKKDTLSSSAKQFLQQIPDLSFMLKPTLSLPKKS
jgi:hypothetical protein